MCKCNLFFVWFEVRLPDPGTLRIIKIYLQRTYLNYPVTGLCIIDSV